MQMLEMHFFSFFWGGLLLIYMKFSDSDFDISHLGAPVKANAFYSHRHFYKIIHLVPK